MSGFRLSQGGLIDRANPIAFTWDGRRMQGFAGDTLASALLANGQQVLARSFKYHRPRGVMSAGVEEGGAIVTVGAGARRTPNLRATDVELMQGLAAFGQNAWPSVRLDFGRLNDLFSRFFAAGFYYKTFMGLGGGTRQWMFFEKFIRRAAGMGVASREPDPDSYDIVHDFCDLLVIGSGPAGLAAAELAASRGLDVMLVEQDFRPGGSLLGSSETVDGRPAPEWVAERAALEGVRVLTRSTAFGLYDGNVVGVYERVTGHRPGSEPALPRGNLRIVRPARVILASGALERPVAFGNNDRPGVMLAHAAAAYVTRFGVAPGRSAVIAGNGDSAYADAVTLARAGVATTLLDAREPAPPELLELAAGSSGPQRRQGPADRPLRPRRPCPARAHAALRPCRGFGRLVPGAAPAQPSRRQTCVERGDVLLRARANSRGRRRRRLGRRCVAHRQLHRARPGRRRRGGQGADRQDAARAEGARCRRLGQPAQAVVGGDAEGPQAQVLRRPAQRRHLRGPAPGRPRGL
jgi:NADPH-dependent 2,4-dienoyl-CoA reductase/sulfur reductase-like enzyme